MRHEAPASSPSGSREGALVAPGGPAATALAPYLVVSWLLFLANALRLLLEPAVGGPASLAFAAVALVEHALLYFLPAVALPLLVAAIVRRRWVATPLIRMHLRPAAFVMGTAVLATAVLQMLMHADISIHGRYGFHFNGFILNLLGTPGGLESLGAGASTHVTVALIFAGFVALQAAALLVALRSERLRVVASSLFSGRRRTLALGLLGLLATERIAYGVSDIWDYRPVLRAAQVVPFYSPVRFRPFARQIGIRGPARNELAVDSAGSLSLHYPLAPLVAPADAPSPNIVWLVAESLRADMVTPEIMPATNAFAAEAVRFEDHYSGGNGTRMGIFSMFYGLPGPYWFPVLQERRSPVVLDELMDRNYDIKAYTSALFSYPEFDRTVWARVPFENLKERDPSLSGWKNDRLNVGYLLDSIDQRPPERPFLRFLFFESAHARYYFPRECVIREPYMRNVDYASMKEDRDVDLIRNRYINACHHLDTQVARVLDGLRERGLLENTIVLVTGDHGEEFQERGRWGHHSAYNRFQTRVPLLLHVPGTPAETVTRMTSHADLPATLLARLGVTTAPSEFGCGHDLLGPEVREDCYVAGWDELACRTQDGTLVLPVGAGGIGNSLLLDADDRVVPEEAEGPLLQGLRPHVTGLMNELSRFRR